jgi:hypothetical protein
MKKIKYEINAIIAILVYVICFWGITEASDLYSYTLMFEGKIDSRDIAFSYLSERFSSRGLEFMDLYRFHIVLIAVSTVLMIRRFGINTLFVTIMLIAANYVDMASQIRFFVALPTSILSMSMFLIDKKKQSAIILAIIALLFHKTVVILMGAFCVIYFLRKKKPRIMIFTGLFANLFLVIMYSIGFVSLDEQYNSYFEDGNITSFSGALYSLLPILITMGMMIYVHAKIIRLIPNIMNDKTYVFLYTMSITPLILLLPSFVMQTIIRRFMITLFPIWLTYYLYVIKTYESDCRRLKLKKYMAMTLTLRMIWVWIMPLTGIVSSRYYEKLYDILINYEL